MKRLLITLSLLSLVLYPHSLFSASNLASRLSGRILLQVEDNGEAWYVSPGELRRYFLGRPQDAFELMREKGIGITNDNLAKIAPAVDNLSGNDSDSDGLPDDFEKAIGSNANSPDSDGDGYGDKQELDQGFDPNSTKRLSLDNAFANSKKGLIFLQVEENGEAWYVSPTDSKRYFLGRPADAFSMMRSLGLGITNRDLSEIAIADSEGTGVLAAQERFDLSAMEKQVHDLINIERKNNGLSELVWDDRLADVARLQSTDLADENEGITSIDLVCDYPMIHHENTANGIYVGERLNNSGVYDLNKNGENIALMSAGTSVFLVSPGSNNIQKAEECRDLLSLWEDNFKQALDNEDDNDEKISLIESEIEKREAQLTQETLKTSSMEWRSAAEIASDMVDGWMNSPGHRANILEGDFDRAGVGLSYVNGYIIGTQVFIRKVDCGYLGGPCCDRGGCYLPTQCNNNICQ
ncbi:hypothetical protein GF382_00755 [Candidatus Falkowbacteria bacterium]|nr:hypothetical protein [Candidatus Falkowbacteria bacterium]